MQDSRPFSARSLNRKDGAHYGGKLKLLFITVIGVGWKEPCQVSKMVTESSVSEF